MSSYSVVFMVYNQSGPVNSPHCPSPLATSQLQAAYSAGIQSRAINSADNTTVRSHLKFISFGVCFVWYMVPLEVDEDL